MRYLTDAKRASGLGASGRGTEEHWFMMVTSAGLVGLIPLFVWVFGRALGMPYDDAVAYFHRPFPAIVTALTLVAGLLHYKGGVKVLIEDYTHGFARKALIIFTICLSFTLLAIGLFALIRLAL